MAFGGSALGAGFAAGGTVGAGCTEATFAGEGAVACGDGEDAKETSHGAPCAWANAAVAEISQDGGAFGSVITSPLALTLEPSGGDKGSSSVALFITVWA